MPKELSPSDRMQLRGRGDLMHPGACCVCGSGNCEEGYIDIGVYYEYEGQVYLCMTCATEVAETAGMLSKSEADMIQDLNRKLAEENKNISTQLDVAHERLQHYDSLFSSAFDDIISDGDLASNKSSERSDDNDRSADDIIIHGSRQDSEPAESIENDGHTEPSGSKSSNIEF